MEKITKWEAGILFFLAFYFQFTAIAVNPILGQIYVGFCVIAGIFILLDIKRTIPLKNKNNTLIGSAAWGAGAYAVLLFVGNYVIIPGVHKIQQLLSATTPVLATNPQLNTFTFGVGVPLIETMIFFGISPDFLSSIFGLSTKRSALRTYGTWALIIGISLAFMIFHLESKGIGNLEILTLVFFMSVISLFLVFWREDYQAALFFHIIANSAALLL